MDDVLLGIVLERLKESPLADQATELLLSAFESDESLSAQFGGQAAQRPSADQASAAPPTPAGAYLRSLTVSGFRGIGQPATLNLQPGPGLTVVVGRNGSGKSSFAEALEVLLTGKLRRWEKLSAVWHEGWRSLHQPEQAEIAAEFLVQGAGPARVRRTWPVGAGFPNSSVFVQVAGEKRTGLERLGWSQALTDYRPFLAHSELEAFLGTPSGLYELLASVLGLEDLTAAADRLAQARLARESALREVKKRLPDLLVLLKNAGDERATACLNALSGRTWDLAAARQASMSIQAAAAGSELDRLRRLAQLTAPTEDDVRDATAKLRQAAAGLDAVAGTPAGRARGLAALLTAALQHHEQHGDSDCPVCGRPGALTAQWRQQLRAGHGHAEIETSLEEARTRLNLLAALALTGNSGNGSVVLSRLNAWGRPFADTYQALNKGAHSAHLGELGLLVGDTRKLADKIRSSLS
jgi:AAA domain